MYQFDDCQVKGPGLFLLDKNSLVREALAPNSIRVSRAVSKEHGQVPVVESTNMGPVMDMLFRVFYERVSVDCYIATEASVIQNKPVWNQSPTLSLLPTRIRVGSLDSKLLLDHHFEGGEVMQILGNKVEGLVGGAGVHFSEYGNEGTGPFMIVRYVDNPKIETFYVGYIEIECEDTGIAFEQHQVFRTPENPS